MWRADARNKFWQVPTNYSEFEADGTYHAVWNATCWQDINLSLWSLVPWATALGNFTIPWTALSIKTFDGAGVLAVSAYWSTEILHDYKQWSDITPHIHWCPTTTWAGNVKWQLEYAWINRLWTITSSTTISVTAATSWVVAQELRSSFPAITGTWMDIGSRFVFRLFRDPTDVADTYWAEAGAFDFWIHYEIDTLWSRQITIK